jgi:hypothetical protein
MLGKEESAVTFRPLLLLLSALKRPLRLMIDCQSDVAYPHVLQSVLEEMFLEADTDKDGRIRFGINDVMPLFAHVALSEAEFLRILQRDVQKKF